MSKYQPKKVTTFLPDIPINDESKDKLFSLASSHNLSELEEFITTDSISLNVKNNNNKSIMHVLLEAESTIDEEELLRCIKFLVERGAPISSIDNDNLTPLFICIKKKYSEIFKFLLEKGASLDINTNDDLTVLHALAKPEHITYDAKGIQSIIPEKIPKITMEGYEDVYKNIVDAIVKDSSNAKTIFDDIIKKFGIISKQFYYNDEREDFNNTLLGDEYMKSIEDIDKKNKLFDKLKNQLNIFYTSETIEDINIADLNTQLNNIKNELNKEFDQTNMRVYNDNVLNAIKSIAYSLELSIYFFFQQLPAPPAQLVLQAAPRPQIGQMPNQLKNSNYNSLITLYKLPVVVLEQRINNNNTYMYNINDKKILNNDFIKYIEKNTIQPPPIRGVAQPEPPLFNFNLTINEGERQYIINYFNLLHTFNMNARAYNPSQNDIQNPFQLYQNIQEIYKYNYIIYIFEKEREKILALKNYKHDNFELKRHLDNLFDTTFKELEKSIDLIKQQLKKIEKLSNEYIDIYNKINGNNLYTDTNPNNIGIYPKIQFPTEIKYTLADENNKINEIRDNYVLYNKHKNSFFHNFVLYFQDIGVYDVAGANPLLNNIPILIPINYNIDIINDNNTNVDDNKDKAYKLYYYDPTYLKLDKQQVIRTLETDPEIIKIQIPKFDTLFNNNLAKKFNDEIKNKILNEIIENEFNKLLVLEINNFFKDKFSNKTEELTYNFELRDQDFNAILLASAGFSHILIPNYEFKNNKFLSISKNKFLTFRLYFDTNYFKINNLDTLKYYKENNFITEILNKSESLLFGTDIKGWTPIYYAIDGNNYEVIKTILGTNTDTLTHYDHKQISPLRLCIDKQLNHLNYLLTEKDNKIHYLNNYIKMLRNELQSNNLLIPLNIDSVFIIALFIQNDILWYKKTTLNTATYKNTKEEQFENEYSKLDTTSSDVNNKKFNNNDNKIENEMKNDDIKYKTIGNKDYNYLNIDNTNIILKKYYDKAKELETNDFGLYGSYWKKYDKNKDILKHIDISKELKTILQKYLKRKDIEIYNTKFNLPSYDKGKLKNKLTDKLNPIKTKLEHYLKFINIRFNSNKNNAYNVFLNKIYVHVLANIIGVDFYLKMEELIIKHYINLNIDIDNTITDPTDATKTINPVKEQLKNLNNLLINNKLDSSNINYLYISAQKNPETVLKDSINFILNSEFFTDKEELISTFEMVVLPYYRDLYKITFKYLKMFISNYHKFIYNQYHGLEILLLLLDNIPS
jgi:hypothetical protein